MYHRCVYKGVSECDKGVRWKVEYIIKWAKLHSIRTHNNNVKRVLDGQTFVEVLSHLPMYFPFLILNPDVLRITSEFNFRFQSII